VTLLAAAAIFTGLNAVLFPSSNQPWLPSVGYGVVALLLAVAAIAVACGGSTARATETD
jgi:hypothetical protein